MAISGFTVVQNKKYIYFHCTKIYAGLKFSALGDTVSSSGCQRPGSKCNQFWRLHVQRQWGAVDQHAGSSDNGETTSRVSPTHIRRQNARAYYVCVFCARKGRRRYLVFEGARCKSRAKSPSRNNEGTWLAEYIRALAALSQSEDVRDTKIIKYKTCTLFLYSWLDCWGWELTQCTYIVQKWSRSLSAPLPGIVICARPLKKYTLLVLLGPRQRIICTVEISGFNRNPADKHPPEVIRISSLHWILLSESWGWADANERLFQLCTSLGEKYQRSLLYF